MVRLAGELNAEIAGIVQDFYILQDFWPQVRFETDKKKAELQVKFVNEDVPKYWGVIEKICKKNYSANAWVYGNKPTYTDFAIFTTLEFHVKGAH